MPTVTETPTIAYSHCGNPYCGGHAQVKVKGVRVETAQTFFDNGGDVPGVERSFPEVRFADKKDAVCSCGRRKEISETPRPAYENLSGFPQDGLLQVPAYDPAVKNTEADAAAAQELAELRAQVAELVADKKKDAA